MPAKLVGVQSFDKLGRIDVLINNAGVYLYIGELTDMPVDDFDLQLRWNLRTAFLMTKYALPHLQKSHGVVLATAVREKLDSGWPLDQAILDGSTGTMRAVLTTGAVAAFGFLPMALATGAGAEVQRPLATVVICGILFSTALTLFILPGVLRLALAVRRSERRHFAEPANIEIA